ncbi:hypothetical protein BV898_00204 [Hypsibius exemplaris]|uniref:Uncharacterized protein n=1 Tax=Hypsibius exemplaris TaxID=2072580 RepID=A0A1W0XF21_HYPEX|nr:hypothetical protein BV898_00204 [Hypsibius exemplaris]
MQQGDLLGLLDKESRVWVHALPNSPTRSLLDDISFHVVVALRIGAVVCQPRTYQCGVRFSTGGHHGLSCKQRLAEETAITLKDVIKRALVLAGIQSTLEPQDLTKPTKSGRTDFGDRRPGRSSPT